jgi:hypothetical protein
MLKSRSPGRQRLCIFSMGYRGAAEASAGTTLEG